MRARERSEKPPLPPTCGEVDGGVVVSACMLEEPRLALRANPRSSGRQTARKKTGGGGFSASDKMKSTIWRESFFVFFFGLPLLYCSHSPAMYHALTHISNSVSHSFTHSDSNRRHHGEGSRQRAGLVLTDEQVTGLAAPMPAHPHRAAGKAG